MKKQGVVWVSTVLYVLISLAILGIVLAAVQPRIRAARDKAAIEQTINLLNEFDEKIIEVNYAAPGNVRSLSIQLRRGVMTVDPARERIMWRLKSSSYQFSEIDTEINVSRISVVTNQGTDGFDISLTLDYRGELDLESSMGPLQPSETAYKLFIKNKGYNEGPRPEERVNVIEIYSG